MALQESRFANASSRLLLTFRTSRDVFFRSRAHPRRLEGADVSLHRCSDHAKVRLRILCQTPVRSAAGKYYQGNGAVIGYNKILQLIL